jgi:hypothetical protein
MKKMVLFLTFVCLLTGCSNKAASGDSPGDVALPVCEQYFEALEKAAAKPKNEKFRASLLQTLENDKAAWRKYGEKEQEHSCSESLRKIQKMLSD